MKDTFQISEILLNSNNALTYFNAKLSIVITCDVSTYGIGAVISHIIQGEEKLVLFSSNTLSIMEQKYSNLERESCPNFQ